MLTFSQTRRLISGRAESGEIMIESMLVLVPVLFVLVFLLCLGFFFYQQWNVQITANETASKVAEVYPLLDAELKSGAVDFSQVSNISKYRYISLISGDKYAAENKSRGESYGRKYLSLVSLAKTKSKPTISIRVERDAFANRHVHTEITGEYRLPFAEGFQVFGFPISFTFSATGDAVCTDLSDYLSSSNYLAHIDSICGSDNKIYKAANSILGAITKISKSIDNHKEHVKKSREQ